MRRSAVCVVNCTTRKSPEPCIARKMYQGEFFELSLSYAEANYTTVLIASARYGLIAPDEFIEPYNLTIRTYDLRSLRNTPSLTLQERRAWAQRATQLLISFNLPIVYLCGSRYWCLLPPGEVPLRGLLPRQRTQWLSARM